MLPISTVLKLFIDRFKRNDAVSNPGWFTIYLDAQKPYEATLIVHYQSDENPGVTLRYSDAAGKWRLSVSPEVFKQILDEGIFSFISSQYGPKFGTVLDDEWVLTVPKTAGERAQFLIVGQMNHLVSENQDIDDLLTRLIDPEQGGFQFEDKPDFLILTRSVRR